MSTATLTFSLPEERFQHLEAVHGSSAFDALRQIEEDLVTHNKGNGPPVTMLLANIGTAVREMLAKVEP